MGQTSFVAGGLAVAIAASCGVSGGASPTDPGPSSLSEGEAASDAASEASSSVPRGRTAADALAPDGLRHVQVLRIEQNFHPNDDYAIALDGWTEVAVPDRLLEVRMWWMDTSKGDERSVFGKGVRRHIDIEYRRRAATAWVVAVIPGKERYTFDVQLGSDGTMRAHGDVVTADGAVVEACEIDDARLVARKVLGLPVGLQRFDVHCTDASGVTHAGHLRPSR